MSFPPAPAPNGRALLAAALSLALPLTSLAVWPSSALAWVDQDRNKIDDRIDRVSAQGFGAAFVDQDPSKRMIIGVENAENPLYAIYVAYDRRPTSADEALLLGTGATMAWPFENIDYIESHATYLQIQEIVTLPGVTHAEAIPVEYATNHYGTRVVRARDSRGLAKAENYALFPSVRQELGYDGNGIVIAILDTGVNDDLDVINSGYPGHESLNGKFLGGGEFWCGQPACATPAGGSAELEGLGGSVGPGAKAPRAAARAWGRRKPPPAWHLGRSPGGAHRCLARGARGRAGAVSRRPRGSAIPGSAALLATRSGSCLRASRERRETAPALPRALSEAPARPARVRRPTDSCSRGTSCYSCSPASC